MKYMRDILGDLSTYTSLEGVLDELKKAIAKGRDSHWRKLQLEIEDCGGIIITGQRPETKAERKKRLKTRKKKEESQEADERELYESLKAKFDP